MNFHFTNPLWLIALAPALAWVVWLAAKSDVQTAAWRRWLSGALRVLVLLAVIGALAGLQWHRPIEGMNIFFLLDRSDSIPSAQQDAAKDQVNKYVKAKEAVDKAGVVVFGGEAAIEFNPNAAATVEKIQAVVDMTRSDLSAAVRLGAAAFPEAGQKRLVLLSDGNENAGDVLSALRSVRALGVTLDVLPVGVTRGNDVSVQKLGVPTTVKEGATFEVKIFVQAEQATEGVLRLYRNDQSLGEKTLRIEAGKNLFTFPQTLEEPGFYNYDVRLEVEGDPLPQNNRASGFTTVRGRPRVLLASSEPEQDQPLADALRSAGISLRVTGLNDIPTTLNELGSFDSIFLSDVAAGDLPKDTLKLLESAVRDFGVGLVCIGGENAFTAGGYRGTPLEEVLPVSMELDSKKVLPSGALALVIDRSGSMFGQKLDMTKDAAIGAVAALGDQDFVGVIAFDAQPHIVAEMQSAKNRRDVMARIGGIKSDGGTAMYEPMQKAFEMLKGARATLKHCVVLTDGESLPGDFEGLTLAMAKEKITVSTVGVGDDINGKLLQDIAAIGHGRFYYVPNPGQLPQVFIKETSVILKSAIYEEPFKPQVRQASELIRGIGASEYPQLLGYVATSSKPRAETPLWTHQGDPLLAHWQYGLGRSVAFTSDARARWAKSWHAWEKYRQFWVQVAQWSLRRADDSGLATSITLENGDGLISVEALNEKGDYRNFLNLKAIVVSPKGERSEVPVRQSGPGHYEAKFPTKEPGAYALNVIETQEGKVVGQQSAGASINYSPEFAALEPNRNLLRRLAETGGGHVLDPRNPADNPFLHDRVKTFQAHDLWEWLLRCAVLLFVVDVALRRIQIERAQVQKAFATVKGTLLFWRPQPKVMQSDESLSALLARRDAVRAETTKPAEERPELFQPAQPVVLPVPGIEPKPTPANAAAETAAVDGKEKPAEGSTASRLLEAKRRAQKK
jgi:secreted protein with Ig-like and vWFA domain